MIVFSQQEATENQLIYHKNCFICNREYWSSSRNSKYCCEECSAKSLVKINKRNKTRRIRRKAYAENQEINRALSKAYALAHEVMALYKVPKTCSCHEFGYDGEILINDDLELYCPNCGNKDQTKMNVARRTCGYIGTNFWNKGRTQEIKERVIHLDNKDL